MTIASLGGKGEKLYVCENHLTWEVSWKKSISGALQFRWERVPHSVGCDAEDSIYETTKVEMRNQDCLFKT